jgi:hypothetical protein
LTVARDSARGGGRRRTQLFAPLCEDLLTVLDGERPEDSIALATAGGSAALKASTRLLILQSLSSSLIVVRLPWRISA